MSSILSRLQCVNDVISVILVATNNSYLHEAGIEGLGCDVVNQLFSLGRRLKNTNNIQYLSQKRVTGNS